MNECTGTFIWYECNGGEGGAVLMCSECGHITVTGNFMDEKHHSTKVIREGVG